MPGLQFLPDWTGPFQPCTLTLGEIADLTGADQELTFTLVPFSDSVSQVCDFGLAKSMETVASRISAGGGGGSVVGTLAWKAPETFRGRYSEASDIFGMAGERQHSC